VRRYLPCGAAGLCSTRAATALCLTIVAAFQVQLGAAGGVSEDVPVPGGREAFARSVGITPAPSRARFVAELTRLAHPVADAKDSTRGKIARSDPGGSAASTGPSETVPIPLTVEVWSRAVFKRPVAPGDVVAAILSNPRAAHLCYGLAGLDDRTLQFLIAHPALITRLYEGHASLFAAFGGNLQIHDDRMVPPGGPQAGALWEAVVGASLEAPERFLRELFERDKGRLAYLFDTVARLDPPHAAFALGLWIQDPVARVERFKSLADVTRRSFAEWNPPQHPFSRPVHDLETILARVRVEPGGTPSAPAQRSAWTRAFDGVEGPSAPSSHAARVGGDETVDAAWLVRAVASADLNVRSDRVGQLSFGQRAFAASDAGASAEALLAIQSFPRFRMLLLWLERSGVRQPSVYAAAVRRAQQLATVDESQRPVALAQFQGVLALIGRLAFVQTLDGPAAEALVESLTRLQPDTDGRYTGQVANWVRGDLRRAISGQRGEPDRSSLGLENALLVALAGRPGSRASSQPATIAWEGQAYRLDLAVSEAKRLRRIRDRLTSPPLDLALELDDVGARERNRTRRSLEEHDAQPVDVAARIDLLPANLLGRHVGWRSDDVIGLRDPR